MCNRHRPSSLVTRAPRGCGRIAIVLVALWGTSVLGADPATSPPQPVLSLANGGYASGEIRPSTQAGVVRWQATPFVSPFDFAWNEVNAIQWPPPAAQPKPTGDFCFELAAGDVLFGSLLNLDGSQAELDVPRLGRIHVQRSKLHRIFRWRDGADLIYVGPNGLVGWHEPTGQKNWREDSGQPMTDKEGASIRGDFGLPDRASIEFEISWKSKPDFVFALGVDDKENTVKRAFRFEAWGGDLVVQRELEQEADLAVVQEVAPGPGRAHLQAYLDQEKGRILVFSPGGKQLADLKVAGTRPAVLPGLYLANIRGDVRLEWLRIGRWNGEIPREVRADQARIHRADGSILYGQVTGLDAGSKEVLFKTEKGETRIPENQVSSVFLSVPQDEPLRMIRAVYQDGARASGELARVEEGAIAMTVPGIMEPLQLPMAGLRSLVVLRHENPELKIASAARLEMEGIHLSGRLVDGRERPDASCLTWHPVGSSTASPLRPGTSGKIVYREPPTPQARQNVNRQPVQRQQGPGAFALRFAQALAEAPSTESSTERRSLFLRSGDVIPSVITGINEQGVTFRTSMSGSTFVPHDKVKAVELAPENTPVAVRLNATKRVRLLTVPRMHKATPPTHLIRSRNGDYLRGRVVLMDDKRLRVETRLENKDLPRDRIARIIWMHADEIDPSKKPAPTSKATRLQAVRNDGVRVTFWPEQVAIDTISGKSDVLGACRVRISEVDQLLFGDGIEAAAALLTYGQWKLQNAPEPTLPSDGGAGGGGNGTESPLVGKPAPDFDLELLDGKKFRLSDNRGKVVVLDFWATWCGPCIQAMPHVGHAAGAFPEKDVVLVAVNLQESPPEIKAMLERHQLHPPKVALDKDGLVAEKYQANAIPQTVVIDREGKIARLYIGGSGDLEDRLKEAIKATLSGEKPGEPKK
jgi:thiol-disulfide isomerase/thioredoxin